MKMRRMHFLLGVACLLLGILATACDAPAATSVQDTPKVTASERIATVTPTTSPPPTASPEVDMTRAREALEAGGELTYEEMVALKQTIVGDRAAIEKLNSSNYDQANNAYWAREGDFSRQLAKCTLVDGHGWVLGWYDDIDEQHNSIPDKYNLGLYMSNPFDATTKEPDIEADLFLTGLNAKQIPNYEVAQPIKFSGTPSIADDKWSVKNPTFTLLNNEPAGPTPTAEQLKGLHITLERTGCFGVCPDYSIDIESIDIEASGIVTFEGRLNTAITGTVTSSISQEKLVELASQLNRVNFFDLNDDYEGWTDVPRYRVTVHVGNIVKKVTTTSMDGPRRLLLFTDDIDDAVDSYKWVYGDK